MQHNHVLPVVREEQLSFYTCGAACINMVLSLWGKNQPQLNVWQDVQDNTGTAPRPNDAQSDAGSFPTQYCDRCSNTGITGVDGKPYGDYNCWYTTPEAMAATLNATPPVQVTADYIGDRSDAIRRIADSLKTFNVPAVFTRAPALHWAVAYGYQYDDGPVPNSVKWNSEYITGIYVHDPTPVTPPPNGSPPIQMVTPQGFDDLLLMSIECTDATRVDQYPVVGGGAPSVTTATVDIDPADDPSSSGKVFVGPWVTYVALAVLWLDPRRWFRYFFRPRRPGPPPR